MEYLIKRVTQESLACLATHYKTTEHNVSLAIAGGNTKLLNELTELCETSLDLIHKEVV